MALTALPSHIGTLHWVLESDSDAALESGEINCHDPKRILGATEEIGHLGVGTNLGMN
jgi:hypothetical protein